MSWSDLLAGALPERVVGFLDEQALRELLGEWLSGDSQKRTEALREQWATRVGQRKRKLFDLLYSRRTRSDDPLVNLLKGILPKSRSARRKSCWVRRILRTYDT